MLRLRGGSALSPFRLEKLMQEIDSRQVQVSHIYAEYWHFCALKQDLLDDAMTVLEKILHYGPVQSDVTPQGELLLVLPRPGTISP